jgi:hypothetical protein
MGDLVSFPSLQSARPAAPRFLARALVLLEASLHAQEAARQLSEEAADLMTGDRPSEADHSFSGRTAAEIGEALRKLILANGALPSDQSMLVALNHWLKQEFGR